MNDMHLAIITVALAVTFAIAAISTERRHKRTRARNSTGDDASGGMTASASDSGHCDGDGGCGGGDGGGD